MALAQVRPNAPEPSEPQLHELPPVRCDGLPVAVRLAVRRSDDGIWRARLLFGDGATAPPRATAEIFCATTEQDLWLAVRGLHDHHLRDLYRSLGD